MNKLTILHLIQFIGIWIYLFISVMGLITYIIPPLYGNDPIRIHLWCKYPLLLPIAYGIAVYMICGAGNEIDKINGRDG